MITNPSIQGALRDKADNNIWNLVGTGAPTNGTSGTGAGLAGPGSTYTNLTTGYEYVNTNTLLSPTWTLATMLGMTGDVTVTAAGVAALDPTLVRIATGTILSADITGTSAGQLGHANGVILVAAPGAHIINELISCILISDFAVAAYTGGGNVSVNIGGGGAALTGICATGVIITNAADAIIEFVPLAATKNVYTENNPLNLVSSAAPTQPGTAAGVYRYKVAYRQFATGL